MTALAWIARHSVGWDIFLPGLLLLATIGTYAKRTSRTGWLPWIVLGIWAAAFALLYIASGADRLWYFSRRRWAMTIIGGFLLPGSIPFAVSTAILFARVPSRWQPRAQALAVFVAGLLTIPLTNVASGFLMWRLAPYMGPE